MTLQNGVAFTGEGKLVRKGNGLRIQELSCAIGPGSPAAEPSFRPPFERISDHSFLRRGTILRLF